MVKEIDCDEYITNILGMNETNKQSRRYWKRDLRQRK